MYGPNHPKPEAARLLGISVTTLERRVREGDLKAVKLGRYSNSRLLIPQSAIDEFLAASVTSPAQGGAA